MKDLGVKVVTGKELGKDFTVDSLRDKGEAKAVLGESLLYVLVGYWAGHISSVVQWMGVLIGLTLY